MTELYATATNIRNQFALRGEYGWKKIWKQSLRMSAI